MRFRRGQQSPELSQLLYSRNIRRNTGKTGMLRTGPLFLMTFWASELVFPLLFD